MPEKDFGIIVSVHPRTQGAHGVKLLQPDKAIRRCLIKQVFLSVSQNPQETPYLRIFLNKGAHPQPATFFKKAP